MIDTVDGVGGNLVRVPVILSTPKLLIHSWVTQFPFSKRDSPRHDCKVSFLVNRIDKAVLLACRKEKDILSSGLDDSWLVSLR